MQLIEERDCAGLCQNTSQIGMSLKRIYTHRFKFFEVLWEYLIYLQVSHDATSFEWKRGSDESDEAVRRYCCEVLHWTPVEVKTNAAVKK